MVENVSLSNFVINHPQLSAKMLVIMAILAIVILSGTASAGDRDVIVGLR